MATPRTLAQKIGDTAQAFEALREALTPDAMRDLIGRMTAIPVGDDTDMAAYASLVQASMNLARIVAANDRAAMIAAATITQSGVARPVYQEEES